MLKHERAPDRRTAETDATARRNCVAARLLSASASRPFSPREGDAMDSASQTGEMEKLLAAIDSRNSTAIRKAARAVLRSAFDHLHDVKKPSDSDRAAMSTLIVSAGVSGNHAAR